MSLVRYPIVGTRHHPPANCILKFLAVDTPLFLVAEPTNPHDPNAIGVWIERDVLPENDAFNFELAGYGTSIVELHELSEVFLGYIPREIAATMASSRMVTKFPKDFTRIPATFAIGADGRPRVIFQVDDDGAGWGLDEERGIEP